MCHPCMHMAGGAGGAGSWAGTAGVREQHMGSASHGSPPVPGDGDESVLPGESFRGGYPWWLSKLPMWTWPVGQPRVCIGCKTGQDSFLMLPFPEGES